VLEHDESLTGYEELYVVLTGHARFTVNDEDTDAPAGTLVFVHDAGARQRAVALVDDTEILTIGAAPAGPFERSGWEHAYEVSSYVNDGDYDRGLERAREILADYPYDWPVLYWASCSAARLGRRDEALELLRFAYELESPSARTRGKGTRSSTSCWRGTRASRSTGMSSTRPRARSCSSGTPVRAAKPERSGTARESSRSERRGGRRSSGRAGSTRPSS
jgi:tetratricopeptide (TPR) repeat protein